MGGILLVASLLLVAPSAKALDNCRSAALSGVEGSSRATDLNSGKECEREPVDSDQARQPAAQFARSPLARENGRRPLAASEIENAIRESLGPSASDAQIRILEFNRNAVSPGRVEFPVSGASPPLASQPDRPFLWRGRVIGEFGENSPCWARVQVTLTRKVVRTKTVLLAGQVIKDGDLESLQMKICPLTTPRNEEISEYIGLSVRRSIAALVLLSKTLVETPPLVRRGSTVHVTAIAGQARISFDGEAHSDGYLGQSVQVTNVHSGHSFFGLVSGENSVRVTVQAVQL